MDKQKVMQLSNDLAKELASIGDDDQFRQWISYFFETLESEHPAGDGEGALQMSCDLLDERLVNGRW